ncbi:unnamed protein product, partial [Polarella glacialis]
VLEYCNCLWQATVERSGASHLSGPLSARAFGARAGGGDGAAGAPLIDDNRLWVALEVLQAEPFNFTLLDMVAFYAEMLAHLDVWAKDLQAALPVEKTLRHWQLPREEDLHLHLAEVAVAILGRWIREADRVLASAASGASAAEFRGAWHRTAEGLLAGLSLRLNGLQQSHTVARRLLPEVLRLERAGSLLCERSGARAVSSGPRA